MRIIQTNIWGSGLWNRGFWDEIPDSLQTLQTKANSLASVVALLLLGVDLQAAQECVMWNVLHMLLLWKRGRQNIMTPVLFLWSEIIWGDRSWPYKGLLRKKNYPKLKEQKDNWVMCYLAGSCPTSPPKVPGTLQAPDVCCLTDSLPLIRTPAFHRPER